MENERRDVLKAAIAGAAGMMGVELAATTAANAQSGPPQPKFIQHEPPRNYAKACVYGNLIFLAGEDLEGPENPRGAGEDLRGADGISVPEHAGHLGGPRQLARTCGQDDRHAQGSARSTRLLEGKDQISAAPAAQHVVRRRAALRSPDSYRDRSDRGHSGLGFLLIFIARHRLNRPWIKCDRASDAASESRIVRSNERSARRQSANAPRDVRIS